MGSRKSSKEMLPLINNRSLKEYIDYVTNGHVSSSRFINGGSPDYNNTSSLKPDNNNGNGGHSTIVNFETSI